VLLDRGYASFREHAFHALEGIEVKTTQPFVASLGQGDVLSEPFKTR
jgi:hypothetical protein